MLTPKKQKQTQTNEQKILNMKKNTSLTNDLQW